VRSAHLFEAVRRVAPKDERQVVDQKHMLTVDEFVEEIPFRETRGHVRRVISNLAVYSALYGRTLRLPDRVIKDYGNNVDF
jgi:soluble lytic murein transglycosylase